MIVCEKKCTFFIALLTIFIGTSTLVNGQALPDSSIQMTFSELNVGLDFRASRGNYIHVSKGFNQSYLTNSYGLSARMQSSFIANYLTPNQKRFQIGDVLAGEVATMVLHSNNPDLHSPIGVAYRFEFGLGTIFRINKNQDIGLNLIILKFARDRVSPNISGSFIQLRYRYKRLLVEGGIEARRDRIFGWLQALQPNFYMPIQSHIKLSLLCNRSHILGLRAEWFGNEQNLYLQNNMNTKLSITARLYYGIYF